MNKPRFLELVKDPDKLEFFDLEKLEEVVANFPYFQAAHVFIAKLAKEQSSMFAAEKLNLAAVCTLDRKNLKRIIQSKPRKLTVFVNREEQPPIVPTPLPLKSEDVDPSTLLVHESETSLEEENNVIEFPGQNVVSVEHMEKISEPLTNGKDKFDEEITFKESHQEIDTSKGNDFYAELEKNIAQLRQAKLDAGLEVTPILTPVADSVQEAAISNITIVEEREEKGAAIDKSKPKQDDENKEEKVESPSINQPLSVNGLGNQLPPPTIENSRLEDILLHRIEDENKSLENDLLIKYFDFLDQKRKDRISQKTSVNHIIDNFISNEPAIPKLKVEMLKEPLVDLSVKSVQPKIKIISENFAKILVLQGKVESAIKMYEALSLKFPGKKAYFANLILELKK